ncbi:MAG: hypothetical protein WA842_11595 [Croceibacterium sp.]
MEDRVIANRAVRFVIETNALDCIHPCSVDDVVRIIESLPQSDWSGLQTFVFRQPTRKQLILSSAWGRLLYYAELTTAKGKPLAKGPAIFLDAIQVGKPMIWSASLNQDDKKELERLRSDGHNVQRLGNKFIIGVSILSARNTQLYRTLLHEVGHWFDWLSKVEEPGAKDGDWESLERDYFARPKAESEAFAHRYADVQRILLEDKGQIPFNRIE